MPVDADTVRTSLPETVPMVRTLGLEFVELSQSDARLRLPDQPAFHNHVGGPHAGAMFTLGESASGALVLANFGDVLDRATPLAVRADIRYLKLAMGAVAAHATLRRDPAEVLRELAAGIRPVFEVVITFATDDGTQTGEMTVEWTLKPTR
jgi:acyl-coenzyme A thioesterase PaaI-like protein